LGRHERRAADYRRLRARELPSRRSRSERGNLHGRRHQHWRSTRDQDFVNVTAAFYSVSPAVSVVDRALAFGNVRAGATIRSRDAGEVNRHARGATKACRTMPVATRRLSESTSGRIGILTRTSAAAATAGVSPSPSVPTSSANFDGRGRAAKTSIGSDGSRGV